MEDRVPMRPSGYAALEAELKRLKGVERHKIVKEIEIPWERPRSQGLRRSREFLEKCDEIADVLYASKSAAGSSAKEEH